jgi:putative spermidine/putrescine transport system permease protein
MAAAVTAACALIAFPLAYYMARHTRGKTRAFFYLAVMLPMWASYLVKVYAWRLILAKEGIIFWFAEALGLTGALERGAGGAGDRRTVAVGQHARQPSWSSRTCGSRT